MSGFFDKQNLVQRGRSFENAFFGFSNQFLRSSSFVSFTLYIYAMPVQVLRQSSYFISLGSYIELKFLNSAPLVVVPLIDLLIGRP